MRRKLMLFATGLVVVLLSLIPLLAAPGRAASFRPTSTPPSSSIYTTTTLTSSSYYVYLSLIHRPYTCPSSSTNSYSSGTAFQYELDNPVRPANTHPDKNLAMRSYVLNTDSNLQRELVTYGPGEPVQPPQFATLFNPYRVPPLTNFYQVHHWIWAPTPDPGTRASPITDPPVTALGLQTQPGEVLHVPVSGYNIGGDGPMEVLVLYADEDTIALRYTREDSSGSPGYTVHVDNVCTDPNLLALYNSLDDSQGSRYHYVPPENRPYAYNLPNMPEGHPIGTARGSEVIVALVDTGTFLDPRGCNELWEIRPGYSGSCPPAR